jgi:aspartate/methionine/tyrosine aminotransferase
LKVPGVVAHKTPSAFYTFANVTKTMELLGCKTLEEFRKLILKETGVSFCTREHFGEPLPHETQKYVRYFLLTHQILSITEVFIVLSLYLSLYLSISLSLSLSISVRGLFLFY